MAIAERCTINNNFKQAYDIYKRAISETEAQEKLVVENAQMNFFTYMGKRRFSEEVKFESSNSTEKKQGCNECPVDSGVDEHLQKKARVDTSAKSEEQLVENNSKEKNVSPPATVPVPATIAPLPETVEKTTQPSNHPHQDYDATRVMIKEEGSFRYTVRHFSRFNGIRYSQPFYFRSMSWEVSVQQKINIYNKKYLSVYMTCNREHKGSNWSCVAEIVFQLVSQKGDRKNRLKETKNLFRRNNKICGFPMFIAWDDVMEPKNGFINNDCIVLEIYIKAGEPEIEDQKVGIIKKPTCPTIDLD